MSDHWIILAPKDPRIAASTECWENAVRHFSLLAPIAEKIEILRYDRVEFFDCGGNFESVSCPCCRTEIGLDWWRDRMEEDYGEAGFQLNAYNVPCCGASLPLNDLRYDWHQGFGHSGISVMNPGLGSLSQSQIAEFEELVGTPLQVIYRHL